MSSDQVGDLHIFLLSLSRGQLTDMLKYDAVEFFFPNRMGLSVLETQELLVSI